MRRRRHLLVRTPRFGPVPRLRTAHRRPVRRPAPTKHPARGGAPDGNACGRTIRGRGTTPSPFTL
ncbi:hypothetical protein SCOCK_600016 [Actinacidiphila cocklensis]|uniref:Uncharacterized protein n=1 Tax=Actinacidiphila cocklensis TaxID=887465 RepID=A0A9W4DXS4_9ACTN|nr:hypothetical protein SCOCK_600016 [Actinacidiphila cocklensis]